MATPSNFLHLTSVPAPHAVPGPAEFKVDNITSKMPLKNKKHAVVHGAVMKASRKKAKPEAESPAEEKGETKAMEKKGL